jgi:endonuclease IV
MLGPVVDWYDSGAKPTLRNKLNMIVEYCKTYGACGMHAPQSRDKTNVCDNIDFDDRIIQLFPTWENNTSLLDDFKNSLRDLNSKMISPHGSYLINLASNSKVVRNNSISIVLKQAMMCKHIGLNNLVFHPGSNEDTELGAEYLFNSIQKLNSRLPEGTNICLENLCSKNSIFKTEAQILAVYELISNMSRVYICFDTAHYIIAQNQASSMVDTMNLIRSKIRTIHLNTPRLHFKPNVDRHGLLFHGHLKWTDILALGTLFPDVPCILETPHVTEVDRLDQINKGIKLSKELSLEINSAELFKFNNSAVVAQG